MEKKPRLPYKFVLGGVLCLLVGVLLLFRNHGFLPGAGSLWPLPIVLVGLLAVYIYYAKGAASSFLLAGIIASLYGGTLLLMTTALTFVNPAHMWPVFMMLAGLGLLLFAFLKPGALRVSLVLPSVTIILLSVLFIPFSFGLVTFSFREAVAQWWPALLILAGGILIAADVVRRNSRAKQTEEDESED